MSMYFGKAYLLVLTVLTGICLQNVLSDKQGWLIDFLQELSGIMKSGYPQFDVPQLDPFPLKTCLYTDSSMFRGNISFEGKLSGFSNYYINNATINPDLSMSFHLIFISTTLDGNYSLEAEAYKGIFPLSGSGPLNIYFSFIELALNGTIVAKDQMIHLSNFDFEIIEVNAILVNAGGLLQKYKLNEVLKPSLRNLLNTAIKLFKPKIEYALTQVVRSDGNRALRNVNIAWILRQLKGVI